MPWLVQESDAPSLSEALLFIHIPRTGGTSLTSDYDVPGQMCRRRCCCVQLLMRYFFYRYKLLEKNNFPYRTYENLYVACSMTTAVILGILFSISKRGHGPHPGDHSLKPLDCVHVGACYMPYFMFCSAFITFFCSTYVFTAPSLRNDSIRRFYLWFWHLTGAYSTDVISGTNKHGFLMHLTAEEMVRHDYVSRDQLERVASFAIVRNPYSRMVSMYMYNRLGPLEGFRAYVRRSYSAYRQMRAEGKWGTCRDAGEWGIFCHRLPMHLFTHDGDEQLVGHVVRMEDFGAILRPDLKSGKPPPQLFTRDPKSTSLPPAVMAALQGMSNTNARPLKTAWQDHYDPETAAMVLEMYQTDFELFGYPTAVPSRPPLKHVERIPVRSSFFDYRPAPASVAPAPPLPTGRVSPTSDFSVPTASARLLDPAKGVPDYGAPSASPAADLTAASSLRTGQPISPLERLQKWWTNS